MLGQPTTSERRHAETWALHVNRVRMERVRLIEADGPSVEHIATPPPRWRHHESFMNEGLRFDVWINWDGRVRIEHDGEIILAMWAPAGDILRDIEARRQAHQ